MRKPLTRCMSFLIASTIHVSIGMPAENGDAASDAIVSARDFLKALECNRGHGYGDDAAGSDKGGFEVKFDFDNLVGRIARVSTEGSVVTVRQSDNRVVGFYSKECSFWILPETEVVDGKKISLDKAAIWDVDSRLSLDEATSLVDKQIISAFGEEYRALIPSESDATVIDAGSYLYYRIVRREPTTVHGVEFGKNFFVVEFNPFDECVHSLNWYRDDAALNLRSDAEGLKAKFTSAVPKGWGICSSPAPRVFSVYGDTESRVVGRIWVRRKGEPEHGRCALGFYVAVDSMKMLGPVEDLREIDDTILSERLGSAR